MNRPRWIMYAGVLALLGIFAIGGKDCAAQATKKPEPAKPAAEPPKKPDTAKPAAESAKKPESAKPAAEPAKKQTEPLGLVPAGTILLITSDGSKGHRAGWEKTAAYEAFGKTGILDSLKKMVKGLMEQVPDENAQSVMEVFEFVIEHGVTISIGLPPGDGPGIPYLTAIAHEAGPHSGVLENLVEALGDEIELNKEQVSKRNVSRFAVPNTPGVEVAWWSEGPHLVFTVGLGAVDAAIAVADGKSPNLAASANGKKLTAKASFDRTGMFWMDFGTLRNRFGAIPVPGANKTVADILDTCGLDKLNQLLMQSGYNGRSLWTSIDVDAPAPRKGLLQLADPKKSTMSMDDLPPLPASHVGFYAQAMPLADAYDQVLALAKSLAKLGPPDAAEQLNDALEQMPDVLGCDLRNDILATLGPIQCVFSDSNQGVLGAEYGLIVQVADAKKLRATLTKVLAHIEETVSEQFVTAIDRDRHGQKLVTFRCAGGAVNPTILIGDKWLCVGMNHQVIEAFAMRLKGDLPIWKPDAETAEALAAAPKKFASISVTYPRQMYRMVISLLPVLMNFGDAALHNAGQFGIFPPFELDVSSIDIPPAEVVVKPLFPNLSWSVVDEAGIHLVTRSSAPAVPILGGADSSTVAVSAVAVALLLPAVQQAREAARRTQSKNNLKQIGLAMHNFHDTFQHFPQGTIPSNEFDPDERQSWIVQLLPYMDQAPLYNQMGVDIRDSEQWDDESFAEAIATQIPTLNNPSQTRDQEEGDPAWTDYVGWAGVGKDAPTEKCKADKKGIFGYDRKTRIADITDGTSNTVMVSDVNGDRGPWAQGGPSTIRALTAKPYVNGPDGIGSPHVGGFHVLMSDGAVRFVSQNIDANILEALATRAGGEVIGDF